MAEGERRKGGGDSRDTPMALKCSMATLPSMDPRAKPALAR
jgi:hypothetical protein